MSGTSSSDEAVTAGSNSLGLGSPPRRDGDSDDEENGVSRGHSWTWMPQAHGHGKGTTDASSGRQGPDIGGGGGRGGDCGGRSAGGGSGSSSVRTLIGGNGAGRVQSRRVVHGSGDAKIVSSKRNAGGASSRDDGGSPCPIHQLAIAPITRGYSSGSDDDEKYNRHHKPHGERSRVAAGRDGDRRTVGDKTGRNAVALSKPITISPAVRKNSRRPVTASEIDAPSPMRAAMAQEGECLSQGGGKKTSAVTNAYVAIDGRRSRTATAKKERDLCGSLPHTSSVSTTLPGGAIDGMKFPGGAWQLHGGSANATGYGSASTTTVGLSASSSFSDVLLNDDHLHGRIAASAANLE